jgi:hypothetical protein
MPRFLRRSQLAPPPPSRPSEPADREPLLLGQVSLLVALNGELEQRCLRAEEALAGAAEEHADLRPLLAKLGMLAGDVLPGVVARSGELQAENSDLQRDVGLLTSALIGSDLAAMERGETDQTNE